MRYKPGQNVRILDATNAFKNGNLYDGVATGKANMIGKIYPIEEEPFERSVYFKTAGKPEYCYTVNGAYFKESELQLVEDEENMKFKEGQYVYVLAATNPFHNTPLDDPIKFSMIGKKYPIKDIEVVGFGSPRQGEYVYNVDGYYFKESELKDAMENQSLFKKNDTVKICLKLEKGEHTYRGVRFVWYENMDKSYNVPLTVLNVIDDADGLWYALSDGFSYPEYLLEKVESQKVQLNSDYRAIVTPKAIMVGCQSFGPEKLQELVNAARKVGITIN